MDLGRGAKTVLLIAAVVVVCGGIKLAAPLLVPLFLAMFIAIVSSPIVTYLKSKGIPVGVGVTIAVLVDIAAVLSLGALIGSSFTSFYTRIPEYDESFQETLVQATDWAAAYGISQEQLVKAADPGSLMGLLASLLRALANLVSNMVLVLLIVVFMLFEGTALPAKLGHIIKSPRTLVRLRRTTTEVNKYLLVKTATSILTGLAIGIWTSIWGLDLPILWGLLAFMLNYIPTLGSIVAAIPAILLAAVQLGFGEAIAIMAGYLVINLSITALEPRILGKALGLSPLVVFLSVVLWGWLLGPVGALLSVPLTMVVKIFLSNTNDLQWLAVLLSSRSKVEEGRLSFPPPAPSPTAQPADSSASDSAT